MAGKGFDYYRNTYTHEQLWEMLVTQADPWSVEQAGSVWTTAKGSLEAARDQLDTSMLETVDYWQGPASEEFQRRMRIVYEYSQTAEEDMMQAAETTIPGIAQDLTTAQNNAQEQNLSPHSELEYEDWLEDVKNVKPEDPDYLTKQEQYKTEYEQYRTDRHDALAKIVADLGDKYATVNAEKFTEPPPPPPSDMPGNATYQPPTGGVFGQDGLADPTGTPPPGGGTTDLNSDGVPDSEQDNLDPVDDWAPGSYDDVDSDINGGGLAGGNISTVGGGGYTGGAAPTGGTSGGSFTSSGSGLFGPARGSGAGSAPGRGTTGSSSPARSGANSGSRSAGNRSGGGRGMSNSSSGRGMNNRGMGPRGGTRSGYADDDDDEETTRETWLREDDINWSRNHTPDEELDD